MTVLGDTQDGQAFDSLPRFDARDFQPPAWATSSNFDWGQDKPGESSKRGLNGRSATEPSTNGVNGHVNDTDHSEDEEETWEDASEGQADLDPIDLEDAAFTTQELAELLAKAEKLKLQGNSAFTCRPPDHSQAISYYKSALDYLPPVPKKVPEADTAPKVNGGIQEVTDEEAEAIRKEEELKQSETSDLIKDKERVEEAIRECTKACWGNLGACYVATNEDKEAVDACSKALEIDPRYVKALQRRAAANDRLSTWSSLTSAQEDYNLLLQLLPPSSPTKLQIRRALLALPNRIKEQQEREKDEMLGKLKELGNGLLGKFGLSTDMFKFDQQEGGGYNMRFER